MSVGLPYKGSKSEIAKELVAKLPPCNKILDACCGGGAVLVTLAQSLKYKSVVGNDINPATIKLLDAVLINKGQIDYDHPWECSRNDFLMSLQKIENGNFTVQDCVNKFCASFGNIGKNYLYGEKCEEIKTTAEKMLIANKLSIRRGAFKKFVNLFRKLDDNGRLQRLEELERLERLERLDCRSIYDVDYSEFDIVYFDIPYKNTSEYDFGFDHEKFYDLFSSLKIPAFLSEYKAPFTVVAEFDKTSILGNNSKKINALEKLYFNGTFDEYKILMGPYFDGKDRQLSFL